LLKQFAVFLCVGGFATALQYAVMFALIYAADWDPLRASAAGFVTSAVVNFALNARFTFKSERSILHTAPRFALVSAIGLLLNNTILAALLSLKIHPFIGQLVVTLCVISWNYTINAIWTFKSKKT
jgi:putative flippase GtrA